MLDSEAGERRTGVKRCLNFTAQLVSVSSTDRRIILDALIIRQATQVILHLSKRIQPRYMA